MPPLWFALSCVSTKHGLCTAQICFMRTLACFGAITQKSWFLFEKCTERGVSLTDTLLRDQVWLHFEILKSPKEPSVKYKGTAVCHVSQSTEQSIRGGYKASLAYSPNSSSETNHWKHYRHHPTSSPWDTACLISSFTTQKIAEKDSLSQDRCIPTRRPSQGNTRTLKHQDLSVNQGDGTCKHKKGNQKPRG